MLKWFRKSPGAPAPSRAEQSPGHAEQSTAIRRLGAGHFERGEFDEAASCFEEALRLDPTSAAAYFNLGLVRHEQGRLEESADALEHAAGADPAMSDALHLLGVVRQQQARPDLAAQAFARALLLNPDDAAVHGQHGAALAMQGRHADAIASFDNAIRLDPGHVHAMCDRATALGLAGRREEAVEGFRRLHETAPHFDYGAGLLLAAKARVCDWSGRDALVALVAQGIREGRKAIHPFEWLAIMDAPDSQLACSRIYAADKYPPAAQALWQGERHGHERIRVAYLSADLHNHATAHLMAELFELHDKERFETIALSFGPDTQDAMRARLIRAFNRFIDVRGKSDLEIARLVRELEVDIAVDLKGYTTDARCGIFAHRPAPVQVSFIGYPGTLGVDYMDYVIADAQVIDAAHERWYTEKVVCMPGSYQVNDSQRRIADDTPARREQGLPEEGFVFCCFNNNYKITPGMFDIWMRLLEKVPGSVLWLLQDNEAAMRNLRAEAARRGVAPDRLVFAPRAPLDAHLARHRLADLFLDTLPYNAHTTASDALWSGLPVLTLKGKSFAARVAASLLHAVGLPEMVTHTPQAYEARAMELATDAKQLAGLRARLIAARAAPLFDTDRFRRHLESAYLAIWQRQQAGAAKAPLKVPLLPEKS
jgi:protein O-GlcNAc transferase